MIGTPHEDEVTQRVLIDHRLRAADPVQRDRARLAVLAEVSLLLASSPDYVRILQKLTELAVPALGDWCAVHVVGSDGKLERVALRHMDPDKLEVADILASASEATTVAQVVSSGQSEWEPDSICVPLPVRGRVIGVLTLVRASESFDVDYTPEEVAFAEELARRVAMYVDNAMLLREVQAREAALRDEATRLETLNRIGQELAEIHDVDEVVKKVCEAATTLTGAEVGVFYTVDSEEPKLAACGATPGEIAAITSRRTETAPAELSLDRVLRLDDVRDAHADLGVLAGLERMRSYLAVPVRGRRGDVLGAIALAHSREAAFDDRAEQLLVGLASLTATATDSARLFRAYRELIAALEKSNHDLDRFAYVTSHDLRAPLRGIANLAKWLEEDSGDRITETGKEHLRLLRSRVQRLEDIIQGVLEYSRAGRVDDEPVDVDTGDLAREVIELLAPPGNVKIRIDRFMPTVRTTRVQLQQVLMNLVGNALAHNSGAEPRVEIGAEPSAEGWEFYIRDNGPGIAPRHHQQIWGLFQTLQPRDRVETTGIGLAIVKKIVETHGGRVWIDSEEGRGATFRFTWPKAPTTRSWNRHLTAK